MSRYQQRRVDELEADIRQSRAHLNDTLHELESRLSPTQLKQDLLQYMPRRDGAAVSFIDGLCRSIREQPMPVLMTSFGLGWLVASQLRSGSRRHAREREIRLPAPRGTTIPARQEAPQHMVATHLGTQQGRASVSTHRPDAIGEATHLGTGQGWRGYVHPES
ncbi:DUF3618 domain-containing protein [Billgrantia bachuensis]|uniref:DUF3618 domain-containing protein n=1 Tax=Billgrantia bachuensis TaxID=2717286 RepID=A0ABX0PQR5_9GAMM|nr:DUF3618 domain-containing protein [Halomonas bachuensis]NIC05692.1 DUF3618 domain-containing protein [Halomonas bachuensis]